MQSDAAAEYAAGCYGLHIAGIQGAGPYLGPSEAGSPSVTVLRRSGVDTSGRLEISDQRASLPLSDGASRADVERESGVVELTLREEYSDEALLHPLLSGSLAVVNWWSGRDAFHAGAVEVDGRAWVVLGDKGQGKSTLLGYLALQGMTVLSDDVVVEDAGDVLAGPAFIDLRPDAARQLRTGRDMGMLGARPRFRLDIPPPPRRVPLGGWLMLAWDRRFAAHPVPLAERLPRLFANRAVRLGAASPASFVRYSALPFLEVRRPKSWDSLESVTQFLRSGLPG